MSLYVYIYTYMYMCVLVCICVYKILMESRNVLHAKSKILSVLL